MSEQIFKPSTRQLLAKARFTQKMASREEMGLVPAQLTKDEVAHLSACVAVPKWLADQEFAKWFFDADVVKVKVAAYVEAVVDKLYDITISEYSKPKDVIAAGTKLLELADAFPKREEKDKSKKPYTKEELDKLIGQYATALAKMENEIVDVTPAKATEKHNDNGDQVSDNLYTGPTV